MTIDDFFKDPIINICKDLILSTFFFWLGLRITNKKDKKAKKELEEQNRIQSKKLASYFKKVEELQSLLFEQTNELGNRFRKETAGSNEKSDEIIKQLKIALVSLKAEDVSSEKDLFRLGLTYIAEKRKQDLFALLETRKISELSEPYYYYLKSQYYYLLKDFETSLQLLSQAIPFPEGDFFIYKTIASTQFENENYAESLKYYLLAYKYNENDYSICTKICLCYDHLRMYSDQLALSKELLDNKFPLSMHLWNSYGNALMGLDRPEEALDAFDRSVILGKFDESIFTNIGNAYKLLKKPDEAAKWYLKSISIDPTFHHPYLGLGKIFWDEKNYVAQEAILKKGLSLCKEKTALNIQLAVCYRNQNNYNEAYKLIESCNMNDKALDQKVLSRTLCDVAYIYRYHKKFEIVDQLLKKSIAIDPNYFGGYYELGLFYYDCRSDTGKANDALNLIIKAISKTPNQTYLFHCYTLLGKIYLYDKADPNTALQYLEKALELKEDIKTSNLRNIAIKNINNLKNSDS